jgi:phenylalanyl-tRNA synthetase beta chain
VEGQTLPRESRLLGIVMTGPREDRSWLTGQAREAIGFYDLKGIVQTLLSGLGLQGTFEPHQHPSFHPGRGAQLTVDGTVVGVIGELHPQVVADFDLPEQPLCALELDLDELLAHWGSTHAMTPISAHPPVYEDIALIVDEAVTAEQMEQVIRSAGGQLLRDVRLFDIYRGAPVPEGTKSMAYALTFQSDTRTLQDSQVAKQRQRIVRRLERELGAVLRG